jgi:anti-sigma regulatory factor (Ser/Thr protein kinase)
MERASGVHEPGGASSEREAVSARTPFGAFRHEALLYSGTEDFVAGAAGFVSDALDADEAVLVAVGEKQQQLLSEALSDRATRVLYTDIETLSENPARLIPAWQRFVEEYGGDGRRAHVIAEAVRPGRSSAELAECALYEGLVNVAFEGSRSMRLLCPYDLAALDEAMIEQTLAVHPVVRRDGQSGPSATYAGADSMRPFEGALEEPRGEAQSLRFTITSLHELRAFVSHEAAAARLGQVRAENVCLAVNEVASNSVRHAGGAGTLRMWSEDGALVCEISDQGRIADRLVGRVHPSPEQQSGRGLWLVNQLCDLVQIRSADAGTVVRMRMWLGDRQ